MIKTVIDLTNQKSHIWKEKRVGKLNVSSSLTTIVKKIVGIILISELLLIHLCKMQRTTKLLQIPLALETIANHVKEESQEWMIEIKKYKRIKVWKKCVKKSPNRTTRKKTTLTFQPY